MMKIPKIFIAILVLLLSALLPRGVEAATLYMLPTGGILGVGQSVDVMVRVDSREEAFNAAQATLQFPKDLLEVTEVSSSPESSVINFWIKEPMFSNSEGTISFAGGTSNAISGGSVPILRITFRAKAAGEADITGADAAITAADGKGTNILSVINIARFTVRPGKVQPAPTSGGSEVKPAVVVVAPPVQISRTPEPAQAKPQKPVVEIPLYPEEDTWYNRSADFVTQWKLSADISGVVTALNKDAKFALGDVSEGLFESKTWGALEDGEWFLHVRFKNSAGWGEALHRKIKVDTRPPLPVEIAVTEGVKTDVPNPTITYVSGDALSGLATYEIRVDGGEKVSFDAASTTEYKLPHLKPGKHSVGVRAVDKAGNSLQHSVEIETLPITSPTITYVTPEVYSDASKGIAIKGAAPAGTRVILALVYEGAPFAKGEAAVDANGAWSHTFSEPLHNGTYLVTAYTQDARGALSLEVTSDQIIAKNRPILQIGGFELDMLGALVGLVVVLVLGFAGGVFFHKKEKQKLSMRVGFTQSEVEKIFRLLKEDVATLKTTVRGHSAAFGIKKLEEDVEKMEQYMKKGIEKIRK